jgi:uncharacterized membrane protein YdfJ with MMPL/SSD domain
MEDNKKNGCFKWRWVAIAVMVILIVAILLVTGGTADKLGREHGYSQLEKDIVYAIALNKSNHVGKFLVAKIRDGGTLIALKQLHFSVEIEK